MNNKELLQLAAKASGLEHTLSPEGLVFTPAYDDPYGRAWNPRKDYVDALFLSLRLGLILDCDNCCATHATFGLSASSWFGGCEQDPYMGGGYDNENDKADIMALAIVRAAAEIGKSMP